MPTYFPSPRRSPPPQQPRYGMRPPPVLLSVEYGREITWPNGTVASVASDGHTLLAPNGRALIGPDGHPLEGDSRGRVRGKYAPTLRVAVWGDGEAVVLSALPRPNGRVLFTDASGGLYTEDATKVLTTADGKPLSAKDGRFVVQRNGEAPQLEDGAMVAVGPDGQPAVWPDGSVVAVSGDRRTVLDQEGRALIAPTGEMVEVDGMGRIKGAVGTYVIQASSGSRCPSPASNVSEDAHARAAQLKEALNHINAELRRAKEDMESARLEAAQERRRADEVGEKLREQLLLHEQKENTITAAELASVEMARVTQQAQAEAERAAEERVRREMERRLEEVRHEAQMEIVNQERRYTDLEEQLGKALAESRAEEEKQRQLRWAAEDQVAELQRELQQATHDDAAALHHLRQAVEEQGRRVVTREDELSLAQKRLDIEESRRDRQYFSIGEERQRHNNEMEAALATQTLLAKEADLWRTKAKEAQDELMRLQLVHKDEIAALERELSEKARELRIAEDTAASAICASPTANDLVSSGAQAEVIHLQHLLEMETARRERAEAEVETLRQQHDEHCEEAYRQLSHTSLEKDRVTRQLREREREADEVEWEKKAAEKEAKHLKEEVKTLQHEVGELQARRKEAELEARLARESKEKEVGVMNSRVAELTAERDAALQALPSAIAESEAKRAAAEERLRQVQIQLDEARADGERLRYELAGSQREAAAAVAQVNSSLMQDDHMLEERRRVEQAHRQERRVLEERIDELSKELQEATKELLSCQTRLEKAIKKKDKSDRRKDSAIAALEHVRLSLNTNERNGDTFRTVIEGELEGLRRERDGMRERAEAQEARLRRAQVKLAQKSAQVDTLRAQNAALQEEKQKLLCDREVAARHRMAIFHSPVASPAPSAVSSVAPVPAVHCPYPTPQHSGTVYQTVPTDLPTMVSSTWRPTGTDTPLLPQQSADDTLASPNSVSRQLQFAAMDKGRPDTRTSSPLRMPSSVPRKSIRWSPSRNAGVAPSPSLAPDSETDAEIARHLRGVHARHNPPISPPPLRLT